MSAFTFDFDLEDDLDESFDAIPLQEPATVSSINKTLALEHELGTTSTEISAEEISLSALVRTLSLLPIFFSSLLSGPSSYVWSAAQLSALPEALSYSPMKLSGPSGHTLARRDLFDARFQLLAQDERDRDERTAAFVDAPADLVPGAYEGGLKTWECALDLAAYLDRDVLGSHSESEAAATATGRRIRGLRVLEVSCLLFVRCISFVAADGY